MAFRFERNSPQSFRSVDSLSVVHWVHESQNSRVLEFFFGDISIEYRDGNVTPFDCYELGFCVAQCDDVGTLKLEGCSIDKEDAAMLALGMKCQEPDNIRMKKLLLRWNRGFGRVGGAAELLSVIASFPCLTALNLWRTNIGLEDCRVLGSMILARTQLRELRNYLSSEAIHW